MKLGKRIRWMKEDVKAFMRGEKRKADCPYGTRGRIYVSKKTGESRKEGPVESEPTITMTTRVIRRDGTIEDY